MNHPLLRLQLQSCIDALRETGLADFEIAARWGIGPGSLTGWQNKQREWLDKTMKKIQEVVDAEIAKGTLLQRNAT